jgi:signal transduction histidine kinase
MNSLKRRIMASYLMLTAAALILVGGGLFMLMHRYAVRSEVTLNQSTREQVLTDLYVFMQEQPDVGELNRYVEGLKNLRGVEVELFDSDGHSVFDVYTPSAVIALNEGSRTNDLFLRESQRGMNSRNPMMHWGMFFGSDEQNPPSSSTRLGDFLRRGEIRFSIAGTPQIGSFSITAESFIDQQLIEPMAIAFTLAALAALAAAAFIGWKISGSLTRPITAITNAVNSMSDGDLSARAQFISRDEEMNLLAGQIHHLADDLQETITELTEEKHRLQRFLVDASHELRTPVTAISAYLELLAGKAGEDPERRRSYIRTCITENDRSKDIVAKLLELLRMERSEQNFPVVDLRKIAEEVLTLMKPEADAKQIKVSGKFDQLDLFEMKGDRYQLFTALKNLVENAVKYSPEGSKVDCLLNKEHELIQWIVIDEGPGINQDEELRLFDRFYRAKDAEGTGTGLGLSMVSQAAENHGGSVRLLNREDGPGLRAVFTVRTERT